MRFFVCSLGLLALVACDGNTSKVSGPAQIVTVCLDDKATGDKSQTIDNSTNVTCDKPVAVVPPVVTATE